MTASFVLRNITKRFAAITALDDVTLEVRAGAVHALLGENGAGKSTLMQIAYGMQRPDSGTLEFLRDGEGIITTTSGFATPAAARRAGLGMVHQHFTSIPALTVAENIALTGGWRETGRAAARRAMRLVDELGLPLDVRAPVERLSVQLRQRLEIVKALASNARILLLDEPTAVLAPREVDELLGFLQRFVAGGAAAVLITHKLDEALRVAGHVTVLRRGAVTLDGTLAGETAMSLARAMIGGDVPSATREPAGAGDVVVSAHRALFHVDQDATWATPATFDVRRGEIVGIAAIEGNGQRALLRAIAGVDGAHVTTGTLSVSGPVAFIPEDRSTEGTIGAFTLTENFALGDPGLRRWISWRSLRARTTALITEHDVRAAGADVQMATLSGGNQQKFVLARTLDAQPTVLLAENPTRGLDILATEAVHARLRAAARGGAAVLVHSSDLDEVLALADRLFVVVRGELHELPRGASRAAVGDAMLAVRSAT